MSRTLGGPLAAHIATRTHTRCAMLRLDLADGTSIGVTDHDRDLDFDLGDGSITYSAATGILPSDVKLSAGFDADNFEVTGPIAETVTREAVLGGRFNRARARLFQVNWKSLGSGAIKILTGDVADARVEGGKFVLAITSDIARFNQVVGSVITPYCATDFGSALCGLTPEEISATVTAATSDLSFTVSFTGSYADDYFNLGTVEFLTGALAGTAPIEIFDWTSAGAVTLFVPAAEAPAIGDTLSIKRGCSRLRSSDDASVPTCMSYGNILNFRGFPEVPGTDQVLKYAVPGNSGA